MLFEVVWRQRCALYGLIVSQQEADNEFGTQEPALWRIVTSIHVLPSNYL